MRFSLDCQSASGMPPLRSTRSRVSGFRSRIIARMSSSLAPTFAWAAMLALPAVGCACAAHEMGLGVWCDYTQSSIKAGSNWRLQIMGKRNRT